MRTTLVIDDDLYREVKALAAYRGATVTSLVEDSLRAMLGRSFSISSGSLPVLPQVGGPRPGVDLDDNAALRDILEAG